ncbi:MAG: excinuclease ABC subunit C [Ignavibacteria bacterium]|nr:excinuclease ABC subunit C [Ignavibacteria bacterium]
MTELEKKVFGLPTKPGVYLHKDFAGKVIYVGKAKNLRVRVKSYLLEGRPVDAKTKVLMSKIADVDVIVTDTEAEALLLENTLIKEHHPKYNILLKDDKSYPYIRITKEEFPKIYKTRRVVRDGSKYFGPYTDGTYLYYLIKTLRSVFPIRTCDLPLTEKSIATGKYKVCLDYHIKKCEGPCEGFVSRERYNEQIRQAQQVLRGKTKDLERQLEERMMSLSDAMKFEDAALVRTQLQKLREYTAKQKVLSSDLIDQDLFALARIGSDACTVVFVIRDGKLVGKRHFLVSGSTEQDDAQILQATLDRWYAEVDEFPTEIVLPIELPEPEFVSDYVLQKAHRNVIVTVPKIGDKRKLLQMAETNADYLLREVLLQNAQKDQTLPRAVLSLQRDLQMEVMPRRIECFDNSHMQGTDYVSSMVVFVDGKPKKSEYRKYRLRTMQGNDDFEAMKEVITRRYSRAIEENTELPNLVIIDGGKGQLSHAMEIFNQLGLAGKFTVIGLAKRLEDVFVPNESDPIVLPKTSSSLRLLQQARDEAHRFAISFHRDLRSKRTLQTELTQIAGIGEKTATELLIHFGSVTGVNNATDEQLLQVVSQKVLLSVRNHFQPAVQIIPDSN